MIEMLGGQTGPSLMVIRDLKHDRLRSIVCCLISIPPKRTSATKPMVRIVNVGHDGALSSKSQPSEHLNCELAKTRRADTH